MSDVAPPRAASSAARTQSRLIAIFPIIEQLRGYRAEWLARDTGAGLAIATVALPIGIAYPEIAGLSPAIGLYSTILGLLGYAVFGSSRQLIVGPDAATLTVVAAALAQLMIAPSDREAVSATLAIIVGILCFLSAAGGLGIIANFLSRPVLTGYLCGISVSLLVGQIGRLTTVRVGHGGLVIELGLHAKLIHMPTLVMGAVAFLLLRLLKAAAPRAPGPLAVLALATLVSFAFDLSSCGIALLGRIPASLPTLSLSLPPVNELDDLVLSALGILVVSFSSGIVTARSFGAKNRYRVDANRELVGFGAANIASGLFGGFVVTGADSRTAVNDTVGGRSQVAGLVAALALLSFSSR